MTPTPRLIAWASGKAGWGSWHIDARRNWQPACGAIIPDAARRCDSQSYETIRKLDQVCVRCLKAYSESETE